MASQDDLNDPGFDEGGPGLDDFEVVQEEQDQGGQPVGSDIDGELEGEQLAPEEEEGEDLMDENYLRDYEAKSGLDQYEAEGLDEDFEDDMDYAEAAEARRRAEEEIELRDGGRRRKRRLPGALEGIEEEFLAARRRRQLTGHAGLGPWGADEEGGEEPDADINIEQYSGRASAWLANPPVANKVRRLFAKFLRSYQDAKGERVYLQRIDSLVAAQKRSLEVDFTDLGNGQLQWAAALAVFAADAPRATLALLDDAATQVVFAQFPAYAEIHDSIFVRLANLPCEDKIRDLRTATIGCLVQLRGVVTRRTGVFPQLLQVEYECQKCGQLMGPFEQNGDVELKPQQCVACNSKGPFLPNASRTIYQNYQKLTLQESPGDVPPGRLPRHKEVVLLNDLIDCARPGEEVQVAGIFTSCYDASLNVRAGFPVFSTRVEANWVGKAADAFAAYKLTDDDREAIARLSKQPDIGERIINSMAPSIYGHDNIKTALALTLFGGVAKQPANSNRLRGDINVLLLGDPGTAKSQFLKYVEKTAMRAVYTTGKGASAVGLTAGVHKDPLTKEWTLEGGALVLADRGICLIDEFDKMNEQDRVSIHEAMEQQSISISKAGIVTQLQARCSVIAAANPINGRYDPARSFAENVELTDPILSRFDILCVVRDVADPVQDQRLAQFVVGSHAASHPDDAAAAGEADEAAPGTSGAGGVEGILPQDLLRKYITYAKQTCNPVFGEGVQAKLREVYARLRQESQRCQGMPIAVRHLESMIRMSEAHARLHLRELVEEADVNVAVRVMVNSFISTQKYSMQRQLSRDLQRFLVTPRDFYALLLQQLRSLMRHEQNQMRILGETEDRIEVPTKRLEERARELKIGDLPGFFTSRLFNDAGFALDQVSGVIVYDG